MTKEDVIYELFWLKVRTGQEKTLNAIDIAIGVLKDDYRDEYPEEVWCVDGDPDN